NPAPDAGARVYDSVAKLAAVVSLADEYTSDAGATDAVTQRFQAHFNLAPEQFVAATETAEETLREQAPMLGIVLPKPARHVSATKQPGGGGATTVVEANAGATEAPSPLAIITEITQAILANENINDILSMVLEGLARAGGFDSVMLALLNAG